MDTGCLLAEAKIPKRKVQCRCEDCVEFYITPTRLLGVMRGYINIRGDILTILLPNALNSSSFFAYCQHRLYSAQRVVGE
jgi:hypothetical protein